MNKHITGNIANIAVSDYNAINPRLQKAFEFLKNSPLEQMEVGKYVIDGTDVFASIDYRHGKSRDEAALEVHDKYYDVQCVIEGTEQIGYLDRKECRKARTQMDVEKDIQFYDDVPSEYVTLHKGDFFVISPDDGHAPLVSDGMIKKCIVKVLK